MLQSRGIQTLAAASLLSAMLSGCDRYESAYVAWTPPHALTNDQVIADAEQIAREADLRRVGDWYCGDSVYTAGCAPGSEVSTAFQGSGQGVSFVWGEGTLLFGYQALPGVITPDTRSALRRVWAVMAKRYGPQNVDLCHLDKCNHTGVWPRRSWLEP
jgi:hypothetical protein